jgi:phenylacetate-coenzyme A ligase PaaK-like adenylate-forming protein
MILADRFNYTEGFYKSSLDALETALNTAHAYDPWRELDPGSGADIDARYDAIPELTKRMIRDNFPTGLVPNHRDVEEGLLTEEVEYTFTSGTTGERVVNIWDQSWWDRAEAASWKLNANLARLGYPQREAKLASSLNVGISCEEDLPVESRTVGRKLYLNEKINLIQWMPRHYRRMAKELAEFRPVILEANPSLLARLAFWAMDEGVELYSPEVITFTYEFVSGIHVSAIKKVFKSPLVSSYGTTETGFVMEECEAGLLHQNAEFCRIDFHPLKAEYGGPELGRILVTTFGNPWNSVVKFDTGDLVRLHSSGTCPCGRHEGLIARAIEGRTSNSTFTTDGRLVTTMSVDREISAIDGIRDYHLEQDGPGNYTLQLMPAPGADDIAGKARIALGNLYGADGSFEIKLMKNILPGPAGKFRRTQANFDVKWEDLFV